MLQFASTDFKVNLLNLKKIKKIVLEKKRFFKKLIRNFNFPKIGTSCQQDKNRNMERQNDGSERKRENKLNKEKV